MKHIFYLLLFLVSLTVNAQREINDTRLILGEGTDTDVSIEIDNFDSDNPKIIWDFISGKFKISHDGITSYQLSGNEETATLTNKTLTSPVINSPTGLVKDDVGLENVDNTSDATKNAASVTLTNKTLTSPVINSPTGIVKGDVGLGNVDNTSDTDKPVSTATQTALDLKADLAGPTFTGNVTVPDQTASAGTDYAVNAQYVDDAIAGVVAGGVNDASAVAKGILQLTGDLGGTADSPTVPGLTGKQDTLTNSAGLSGALSDETGTGLAVFGTSPNITTPTGIVKGDVGLSNVDNTSDANKPISTATQTALDLKYDTATATAALALKANLASPTFTGVPLAPTAAIGTTGEQIATVGFANNAVTALTTNFATDGPSLLLDFANSKTLDSRITFTRASTATFVNSKGLIETAAINQPRFDHDPTTLESLGLLIEESRTNLATYSQQFDNAVWIDSPSTITITPNNEIAPDGTLTADTITESNDGSSVVHTISHANITKATSATTYTFSVFVKKGTTGTERPWVRLNIAALENSLTNSVYASFNFDTEAIGTVASQGTFTAASFNVQKFPDDWFRLSLTGTTGTESTVSARFGNSLNGTTAGYQGDGTGTLIAWQADLQAGSFITSPIPTVASSVTRSADSASMTGTNFSSWYKGKDSTVIFKGRTIGTLTGVVDDRRHMFSFNNGASDNYLQAYIRSDSISGVLRNAGDSLSTTLLNSFDPVQNQTLTYVTSLTDTGLDSSVDGATVENAVRSMNFDGMDSLIFGANITPARHLNGHIAKFAYYPRRLSNAEIEKEAGTNSGVVGTGKNQLVKMGSLGKLATQDDISFVGASYSSDNSQSIGTSVALLTYEDTEFERGVSCSTGSCPIQEPGIYQVDACYGTASVNLSTSERVFIQINVNGTARKSAVARGVGASVSYNVCTSPLVIPLVKGDIITVVGSSSVATTMTNSGSYNFLNIARLGK